MARAEMPAEHAILGLLSMIDDDGSGYGYDLARYFAEGQPLAEVLRLEPGMLYHHLKKLDRAGWVVAEVESVGTRPPRRVYQITAVGRQQLDQWLSEPVTHTREIRLEFLVKLYFARRLDPARVSVLLAEQVETLERIAMSLRDQVRGLTEADLTESDGSPERAESASDNAFTRLVLELRLAQTEAAIAWLANLPEPLP